MSGGDLYYIGALAKLVVLCISNSLISQICISIYSPRLSLQLDQAISLVPVNFLCLPQLYVSWVADSSNCWMHNLLGDHEVCLCTLRWSTLIHAAADWHCFISKEVVKSPNADYCQKTHHISPAVSFCCEIDQQGKWNWMNKQLPGIIILIFFSITVNQFHGKTKTINDVILTSIYSLIYLIPLHHRAPLLLQSIKNTSINCCTGWHVLLLPWFPSPL